MDAGTAYTYEQGGIQEGKERKRGGIEFSRTMRRRRVSDGRMALPRGRETAMEESLESCTVVGEGGSTYTACLGSSDVSDAKLQPLEVIEIVGMEYNVRSANK